jgi:hypothetical protein
MSFKRFTSRDVGTVPVDVGTYTVPANTVSTLIGMTVANVSNSAIEASVFHRDTSNNDTYIVFNVPVPIGSSVVAIGGSQKVVLETGDKVFVEVSANTSADVIMSLLEIEA